MATLIATTNTQEALKALYPLDDGSEVVITDAEVIEAAENYAAMQEMEREVKAAKTAAELVLKAAMKTHAVATVGAFRITWKAHERAEYTVAAATVRPLSVKKQTTPD